MWLQIYIQYQKHRFSSNLRNKTILGVAGTSTSDLFDHNMPLDNRFSFIFSLLWFALLFSVSDTMLTGHTDVKTHYVSWKSCCEPGLHSLWHNCVYHCVVADDTRCNRSQVQEINYLYKTTLYYVIQNYTEQTLINSCPTISSVVLYWSYS